MGKRQATTDRFQSIFNRKHRASRTNGQPRPSRSGPTARRLRLEALEDRRLLAVTLRVDATASAGGDGLAWNTAFNGNRPANRITCRRRCREEEDGGGDALRGVG